MPGAPRIRKSLDLPVKFFQTASQVALDEAQTKKPAGFFPAGLIRSGFVCLLLDFHGVPGVDVRRAEGDQHRRTVAAGVQDDALAQHLARQIFPLVTYRRASEAVQFGLISSRLRRVLVQLPLITEEAHVISNFHTLRRSQIDVDRRALPFALLEIDGGDHHPHGLPAYRREVVERTEILERRHGPFFKWPHDVAALHVVTGKCYFRDGSLGQNIHHFHLPKVLVQNPNGSGELELAPKPLRAWVLRRPHYHEAVAHAHAFVASLVEINSLPLGKDHLIADLFAGDEAGVVRKLRVFHKPRTVNLRITDLPRGSRSRGIGILRWGLCRAHHRSGTQQQTQRSDLSAHENTPSETRL